MKRGRRKWLAGGFACALLGWLFCGWFTVAWSTRPLPRPIPERSKVGAFVVSEVETESSDGLTLRGWLVNAEAERVVVVFAGYGGNRTSSVKLARFYAERGWSVILPDLRGTGESDGDQVGMGYPERLDVLAWSDLASERFDEVALHGRSLGAAAIAYSFAERAEERDYAFVVLDSCYDELWTALTNRLFFLPAPRLLLKPVEWFGEAELGAPFERLAPVSWVPRITCPVLVVAGDGDPRVQPRETEALFEACGSEEKRLVWIQSAGHVELWNGPDGTYGEALGQWLASAVR